MAVLATVAVLMGGGCQTDACELRGADRRGLQGRVGWCIHAGALRWNVSWRVLARRAWCESRRDPGAYNPRSGASGLFQFLRSTWQTTPYARRSIWSARWSSRA